MRSRSRFRRLLGLSVLVIGWSVPVFAQAPAASDVSEAPQHPNVPPVTDADRRTAFPDVEGHAAHDNAVHYLVRFNRLEWQSGSNASGLNWDNRTWVGRDRDRLWIRSEGQTDHSRVGEADAHVLYGRAVARWWDVVAGVRQDFRPGSPQTWAAVGVQGLAPYWFDVEATGYIGQGGRIAARVEVEYELLLTNRLIVQPRLEHNLNSGDDLTRGTGGGLSTADPGIRIRYEFRREFAPYLGVTWNRRFGRTADFADAAGEAMKGVRLATGLRWWF